MQLKGQTAVAREAGLGPPTNATSTAAATEF